MIMMNYLEFDNDFYKKRSIAEIYNLIKYLELYLLDEDYGECITYDDEFVWVDAGLTMICFFSYEDELPQKYMEMLKEARELGADPTMTRFDYDTYEKENHTKNIFNPL